MKLEEYYSFVLLIKIDHSRATWSLELYIAPRFPSVLLLSEMSINLLSWFILVALVGGCATAAAWVLLLYTIREEILFSVQLLLAVLITLRSWMDVGWLVEDRRRVGESEAVLLPPPPLGYYSAMYVRTYSVWVVCWIKLQYCWRRSFLAFVNHIHMPARPLSVAIDLIVCTITAAGWP